MDQNRVTPEWAAAPFKDFFEHMRQISDVFELSMEGVAWLTRSKTVAEWLARNGGETSEDALASAHDRAERAKKETDADFPNLAANATVALWGSFETLINHILKIWVANSPQVLRLEPWSKVKIRFGEYELLDVDQRLAYIVDAVEQQLSSSFKSGVGRFEPLLETIGLRAALPDSSSKTFFEFHQVRNAIVHHRGLADDHFCRMCPWLNLKHGEPIPMSSKLYYKYWHAANVYAVEIFCRVGESFGEVDIRTEAFPMSVFASANRQELLDAAQKD